MLNFFTSPVLTKATENDINQKIDEILEEFAIEFMRYHKVTLLNKCKEEVRKPEEIGFKMEAAPLIADALKTGTFYKVFYYIFKRLFYLS
jgi:hypothetical protein